MEREQIYKIATKQKKKITEIIKQRVEFSLKVFVFDEWKKKILAPLVKQADLYSNGVVDFAELNAKRGDLPRGVDIVYFIRNTPENVDVLIADIIAQKHSECFVNFSNSIDRRSLELLASKTALRNSAWRIKSIYDAYTDFVSLDERLFSLEIANSLADADSDAVADTAAFGIASLFATLDKLPIVLSTKSSARTRKYVQRISDALRSLARNNIVKKHSAKRALLIVFDREDDVFAPVEHSYSYAALMNDFLELRLNRIRIENTEHDKPAEKYFSFDIEDPFWMQNKNADFFHVSENITAKALEYKKEIAKKGVSAEDTEEEETERLLRLTPEMMRKGDYVNVHVPICMELMNIVKDRMIDTLIALEKETGTLNKSVFEGKPEEAPGKELFRTCLVLLERFKEEKDIDLLSAILGMKYPEYDKSVWEYFIAKARERKTEEMQTRKTMASVFSRVKKTFQTEEKVPKIIEMAEKMSMNFREDPGTEVTDISGEETLAYFEIESIVVFVVGGGSMQEFKHAELLEKKLGIPVVYGGTEVLNSDRTIEQISCIAKKTAKK